MAIGDIQKDINVNPTPPLVPQAEFVPVADEPAWHDLRATGLGGSDAGALLGVSPYKSPYALWAEKTGAVTRSFQGNEVTYWGNILEAPIAERFASDTTDQVVSLPRGCYRNHERPYVLATPDRLIVRDDVAIGVLEVKTAGLRTAGAWQEGPPLHYQAQVGWYQWGCGLTRGWLAVLIGGQEYRVYVLDYDESLGEIFAETADRFMDQVRTGTPPDVDGHRATTEAIHARFAKASERTVALDERPEMVEMLRERRALRTEITTREQRVDDIDNELKSTMADASVATVAGQPVVTWRNVETCRIDTSRLKKAEPEVAARFANTTTSRRFVVKDEAI